MTTLVSLLFITMIHITCKITNFSLHLLYKYYIDMKHTFNFFLQCITVAMIQYVLTVEYADQWDFPTFVSVLMATLE